MRDNKTFEGFFAFCSFVFRDYPMAKKNEIIVKDVAIKTMSKDGIDYISITDIARQKNATDPNGVIANWMRNRNTVEFLGIWETTLSPTRWIEATNAIGIVSQAGRYGGTFAQTDIAFEFASWISVEFRLYLVMEFQRLKAKEQELLGWTAKRELSKINYRIHTDAIKSHLIPEEVTPAQASIIYAEEADVLNVAMFGMTAKQWREANPDLKGNIRDYATINELICLSNMENITNAGLGGE